MTTSTLTQLFSDALSVITISTCLVLKVPQIINVLKLKSVVGLNVNGFMLELFSYTSMLLYNYVNRYTLLSYMEYPIILAQELVLIYLVLFYSDLLNRKTTRIAIVIYFGVTFGFVFGLLPSVILTYVVPLCTPIGATSKMMFLYEILKTKNSEAVSLMTWFISAGTNMARIFTVYVESGDTNLLANFIISSTLSSSVLFAAWFYKQKRAQD